MNTLTNAYQWLMAHPWALASATTGCYHVGSAFIGALQMPDEHSSDWYKFFFAFANRLAANYSRAQASKDINAK